MAELPTGTVTFLFSDVEGSTRLLTRLRDRYRELLGEHQLVLRAAFDEYDGREVGTQGDGFFVAFARARDAIAAAVSAQRSLASREWPEGVDVRVRMGVHTGEADVGLDGYVGLDVHRAARICAAGHGGQVLISGSTRELVADALPTDVALRDLGEHRLKDLERPEHLFQLVIVGLPADFPAPVPGDRDDSARQEAPPSAFDDAAAVPLVPNRTVGRKREIAAVASRLKDADRRVITLTGPGGVGKTRVAVEAARAAAAGFRDGARFVSLAAVVQADDVAATIVQTLGIVPLRRESPEDAVTRYLAAKDVLVVLDNFEHVLGVASFLARLIEAAPTVTVLATSREPLGIAGEQCYALTPLGLPGPDVPLEPAALREFDAIELFCRRAQARLAEFELDQTSAGAIAEICRRVDGLPLGVELAAARCGLLSPPEIADRLGAVLDVLGPQPRDAPARQRTLRAALAWSHDLLTEDEKTAFARFAVFAGGATVGAAEAVTGADLGMLQGLLEKSLLIRSAPPHASTRLDMLETTRAYAVEQLAAEPDRRAVHDRHLRHFLDVAREHGDEEALKRGARTEHLMLLDADADNLDAALGWALGQGDAVAAIELCAALDWYWVTRFRRAHALAAVDEALQLCDDDTPLPTRLAALLMQSSLFRPSPRATALATEAEALAREIADPPLLARALELRADCEIDHGRTAAAARLADEALGLADDTGDAWKIASAWRIKARAAPSPVERVHYVDRAATALAEAGNMVDLANIFIAASYGALCDGDDMEARAFTERAVPLVRALDDPYMWMNTQANHGVAALALGDLHAADPALREALSLSRRLVIPGISSELVLALACVAAARGDLSKAGRLVGAAAAHRDPAFRDVVTPRVTAPYLDDARARVGQPRWEETTATGRALSLDLAILCALDPSTIEVLPPSPA